jgi:hypothetical protein
MVRKLKLVQAFAAIAESLEATSSSTFAAEDRDERTRDHESTLSPCTSFVLLCANLKIKIPAWIAFKVPNPPDIMR